MSLIKSYKEFALAEKVKVKQEVIYEFLSSSFNPVTANEQLPIIDYIFRYTNQFTIAVIEYSPQLLLPAAFVFAECSGRLYYGQFTKFYPLFYILDHSDFKD